MGEFKLEAAIQERVVVNVHDLDKILLKQGFLCFIKYPNKSPHICLTDWAPVVKKKDNATHCRDKSLSSGQGNEFS